MQTETYINAAELQSKFRIEQAYKPDFGKFLAVRWLYSITATGGKTWQQVVFFLLFTFTLSPLAFVADLTGIALWGLLLLAKRIIEGVLLAVLNIVQTVATRFLGTAAIIAAITLAAFIIYYKWQAISDFIKGQF